MEIQAKVKAKGRGLTESRPKIVSLGSLATPTRKTDLGWPLSLTGHDLPLVLDLIASLSQSISLCLGVWVYGEENENEREEEGMRETGERGCWLGRSKGEEGKRERRKRRRVAGIRVGCPAWRTEERGRERREEVKGEGAAVGWG